MMRFGSLVRIGTFTAVGFTLGITAGPGRARCNGVLGAAAGMVAGALFNNLYEGRKGENDGTITYYSKSLPLYEDSEEIGYI